MGVPKFFRWLSERYPLINQPIHCVPREETKKAHGLLPSDASSSDGQPSTSSSGGEKDGADMPFPVEGKKDVRKNTNIPHIMPEFDRLYLDMNGIIHCASHNNSEEEVEKQIDGKESTDTDRPRIVGSAITEEQIFQNVCYYLDRVISDIVQPTELVFLAIDGVAPRAKQNQQRSRRYRSGTEEEIEHHLMTLQRAKSSDHSDVDSAEYLKEADGGAFDGFWPMDRDDSARGAQRFSGKIEATTDKSSSASVSVDQTPTVQGFHSNAITPGTLFFDRCSSRIIAFIREKLETDPRWKDLTIIFSGHDVPGEGEHKIMDFIRHEKHKPEYDPNKKHCIYGQDGDLVMLSLATHEPHMCLLREEVVFDMARRKVLERLAKVEHEKALDERAQDVGGSSEGKSLPLISPSIASYIHNANFELLHVSLLRDYLGLEFETQEFYSKNSRFKLEPTIDDFVFMTFFVGNDFLPHMPALDIGDEAFDLLFYAYKKNRIKWLKDGEYRRTVKITDKNNKTRNKTMHHPYLTDAGNITSGTRLEAFLSDVGGYEDPYYSNRRESMEEDNERIRKADRKAGRESVLPPQDVLDQVEMVGQEAYHNMLLQTADLNAQEVEFTPVMSGDIPDSALMSKLSGLLQGSLSPDGGGVAKLDSKNKDSLVDVKGRYYYEKFGITPFDAEKHMTLRKEYVKGLVWTLEYYYKGCVSWDWYYPYNYGPMISDLTNMNSILNEVSFFGKDSGTQKKGKGVRRVSGEPLRPFEQLLGCLPPSSSYLLPKPYRWLMTSPESPLKEYYPESFTVDMNGKRWPWEAVTLLPFIDAEKLIEASRTLVDESLLSEEEKKLNVIGQSRVFTRSENTTNNFVRTQILEDTRWGRLHNDAHVAFQPELSRDTELPGCCFPTLKDASINRLSRRKVFINVFGLRSRYRTALIETDNELPELPPANLLAQKFIGSTVYFRYPILHEGLVCAVADSTTVYRGNEKPRKLSSSAQEERPTLLARMYKELQVGEGKTGTGGLILPKSDVTISLRPLERIDTLPDGMKVKVYAKREIELPFAATLYSPSRPDPRIEVPARLENDPYMFGKSMLEKGVASGDTRRDRKFTSPPSNVKLGDFANGSAHVVSESQKMMSSRGFSTFARNQPTTPSAAGVLVRAPRRPLHTTSVLTRRGSPRMRLAGAAGALAFSSFFLVASLIQVIASTQTSLHACTSVRRIQSPLPSLIEHGSHDVTRTPTTPPIEFAHGTTTLSFVFQGGVIAAVDSRASIGNFVGSKTVQKVLPVSSSILGTMAGGAADCSFWIRFLRQQAKLHEVQNKRSLSVARSSRILSNMLYQNRGLADLSVGSMIMGYDDREGFSIYYVDNTGARIRGEVFSVGSGSTFALGILDTELRYDMTEAEAISLGIKAIRHATARDAMSGGYIGVYLITKEGWAKVYSEDLAARATSR